MNDDQRFLRYLEAKSSVDDRALNGHVVATLRRELERPARLRVLEIGAGLGTMVARAVEWDLIKTGEYCLLDADSALLDAALPRLEDWAKRSGRSTDALNGALRIRDAHAGVDLTVRCQVADLGDFLAAGSAEASADLLIANAVLDLVDLPRTLPRLLECLAPGGLFWFSINFDGETGFLPEHALDRALLDVYHASMDTRVGPGLSGGSSRSGRRLFAELARAGARVLAAGSSDWLVFAQAGRYPGQEADFLRHILDTIDQELNWRSEIDRSGLTTWLELRRSQVDRGELVYLAHQLDFVGRRGD
jgi:SAM-dependent methyltransferase